MKRLKKKICEERLYGKILHKVSYLSTVVPFEYELISKRYNHIQYCPFRYMDNLTEPEEEALVEENEQNVAKRILLGNSNDPSNNHLDILCRLNDIGVKYEVVVPFSYPNNNLKYVQYVLDYSKNLKNLKISFLQDFMPYDEYFRVVKSCQTAIFGHVRQQAVGNISYMMNSGKNVFLYKDSVLYSYYKKNDYEFFSIDEDLVPQKIETPLSIAKKRNNHKKNVANHDYQAYIKKLQMFFDNLDQRK